MSTSDGSGGALPTTIAIVGGTGKLGVALATRLAAAGRTVHVGSRDRERARATARAIVERVGDAARGLVEGGGNAEAAAAASIVVIAVPFASAATTVVPLADHLAGRIVVSTAVPIKFERGAAPSAIAVSEGSAAEQLAALLPLSQVVGALHTVSHVTLADPALSIDADILVTGDDDAAKLAVAELLRAIAGARPVDAGPLRNTRYVEQLTILLLSINLRNHIHAGVRVTSLTDAMSLGTDPAP